MPIGADSRLGALVAQIVREGARAAPPPPALPYLGLERPSGTAFALLDRMAARGIFRKYEHVLELSAGLGAHVRWLAARLGCEAVGTTASTAEATAGAMLTRRTGGHAHARLLPA